MLMNFETQVQIEKPGPIKSQEQSLFFQKLIPDVRRLIYLEVFGSRSVHVVHGCRISDPAYFLYTCRQPDNADPHSECPDIGKENCRLSTNLLYTCQMAYHEGATLLFKSNKLLFPDHTDCAVFFTHVPDSFQNSVRSLDICVNIPYYGCHLIYPLCEMLSNWTGDFKLRMRWDIDDIGGKETGSNLNTALTAIKQLMENKRVRPKFWVSKNLEEGVELALEKEDRPRLEFVRYEAKPDDSDTSGFDPTAQDDDEDEDEDEDDWYVGYWDEVRWNHGHRWYNDGGDYYEYDSDD
ncbi:hypothetical protein Neosp_005142 [[Neocosmospora] mangrovei]